MAKRIFIGKFIPRNLLGTVKEDHRGNIGFSNHNFEMSLIGGFMENCGDMDFLSFPGVYSFPHNNRRLRIHSEDYDLRGHHFHSVGFCNLVGINKRLRGFSGAKYLKRIVEECGSQEIEFILNAPTLDILKAVEKVKRRSGKDILVTMIVPDVPSVLSQMGEKGNPLKRILVNRQTRKVMKLSNKCDKLVLLTEQMKEFYPEVEKYIVMEGLIDKNNMQPITGSAASSVPENPYILYTGSLYRIFGIMNLVDAFEKANLRDIDLLLCGHGDTINEIKQRAQRNSHIKYLGLVDSEEALRLQRGAMILVNPRTSEGDFTKYSFPSKTMEYLLAGRPVVANKLPGIPQEYDRFIQYPASESVDSLAAKLKEIAGWDEERRFTLGKEGRKFVLDEKNSIVQTKRILDI